MDASFCCSGDVHLQVREPTTKNAADYKLFQSSVLSVFQVDRSGAAADEVIQSLITQIEEQMGCCLQKPTYQLENLGEPYCSPATA